MTSVHIPDDVLDAENALKQCGDWTFLASLLEDVLAEKDAFITTLEATLKANEHRVRA